MIDAKVSFMNQLTEQMSDVLTVDQTEKLMKSVRDLLETFEMYEHGTESGPDDMLDCYVAAMKVECRSQKTIDRYVYEITRLMEYAKVPTRRISVYHIRNYLTSGKERGIADQTLEGQRQIFSAYFNWLQRECLIERNPTTNLGVIKVPIVTKQTYSEVDLEKLNQKCHSMRDRAIIHFLGSTGCRISEMTGLDRDQVDLRTMECTVHGKGNKERTVYMDEVACMLLWQYLETRQDSEPALFVGKGNRRLHPGGVRAMLNKLGAEADVDHVHPHKFRRTLATNMARHGMPVQEVAAILGHEKIDTTMKYVVLNKDDIKSSYRRFA